MPRKFSEATKAKQALNARRKAQEYKLSERLKDQKHKINFYAKLRRDEKKERDHILMRALKRTKAIGLYNPKELKLTKYRRMRANNLLKTWGTLLDPKEFFFLKADKVKRKTLFERAESLLIKHTKTGLLVPRQGHTKAELKTDKTGEEYIKLSGKTKRGKNKGRTYTNVTPIASLDELDKARDRLRNLAKKLGPLKSNERLTFIVIENGIEGYSERNFSDIDQLLNALDEYQKSIASRINFYRHIQIQKITITTRLAKYKPRRAA